MSFEIEIVDDPARACSVILLSAVMAGGHVVLTGGSTPRQAYRELAQAVRDLGIDLEDTVFWFGDERCVPAGDDRANYKLAKEALFDPLSDLASLDVKRIQGELGHAEGADAYEQEIKAAGTPRFEVVLMGLGPDAHTASLFPGQPALGELSRLVVGVPEAGHEPFVPRISLTLPALAHTNLMVFLVEGESKADAVLAAFGPDAKPDPQVPASMVRPLVSEMLVLLDPAAAAKLP
ncbi:MAG: 6-phosphogluconolactonase [Solirubrobacteraceae bacterium]